MVAHAFDELGAHVQSFRSTNENLLVHAADSTLGRPIDFIWIGWQPQSLFEQPFLSYVLMAEGAVA